MGESPRSITKLCRICLEEKKQLAPLLSQLQISEGSGKESISLLHTLQHSLSITLELGPDFPGNVCSTCMNLIISAYMLKRKFEASAATLEKWTGKKSLGTKDSPDDPEEIEISDVESDPPDLPDLDEPQPSPEQPIEREVKKETAVEVKSETKKETEDKSEIKTETQKKKKTKKNKASSSTGKKNKPDLFSHTCPACLESFSAKDLRKHVRTHTVFNKYLNIPDTEKVVKKSRFYTTGDDTAIFFCESENKRYKCPYCTLEMDAVALSVHVRKHRSEEEYKCDKCERVFSKLNSLKIHKLRHSKQLLFKCEACGKSFTMKQNYDCHLLTHQMDVLPLACSYCEKRFANPVHLKRHEIVHTENITYGTKYKVTRCPQCLKTFKDENVLKSHECSIDFKDTKNSLKKMYNCKLCEKQFGCATSFYHHKKQIHHFNPTEKIGKKNSTKKIKCNLCPETFADFPSYSDHKNQMHPAEFKTLCSICGISVANIKQHMMKHTGDKPFACDQCPRKFYLERRLKEHALVHQGVMPYVCHICGKGFQSLYNMQLHVRRHNDDRRYSCSICEKAFFENAQLKKHLKTHYM